MWTTLDFFNKTTDTEKLFVEKTSFFSVHYGKIIESYVVHAWRHV